MTTNFAYGKIIGTAFLLNVACQNNSSTETVAATNQDSLKPVLTEKTSARPVHWSYTSEEGPNRWGELSPVYALCKDGKNQSPINLSSELNGSGTVWEFNYASTSLRIAHNENMDDIVDNGHTIQVTVDEGSKFTFAGKVYHLKQFHFHCPSEHQVDGKAFPMEVHFVHQNDSGKFAVVSILVKEGKENDNFKKIIENFPAKKGENKHLHDIHLALQFHLPEKNEAYHYTGSLTTPPCSEQVEWLIFRQPVEASKAQLDAFYAKIANNNRPIQALNNRTIKSGGIKGTRAAHLQ